MVCMGGDLTLLLGLLCPVCCCTHFRGCDSPDGQMGSVAKVSTQVASQTNNLPFDQGKVYSCRGGSRI